MSDPIKVHTICGRTSRETTLDIGGEYIIQPLNPQKKKHRDRRCVILDFIPVSEFHPKDTVAKIRFMDNNRIGRAELSDLVPSA